MLKYEHWFMLSINMFASLVQRDIKRALAIHVIEFVNQKDGRDATRTV